MTESTDIRRTAFSRSRRPAGVIAVVCVIVFGVAGFFDAASFFRAYLFAWLLCLSIPLGAMALLMTHHLTGGRWGWPIRRPAEAAAATMPFVAVAFLPLALGAHFVFPWADSAAIAASVTLRHRQLLFNVAATMARAVIFFILWSLVAWLLRRWSLAHDRTGDSALLVKLRSFSAAAFVIYFVTMSLASVDWIMSREVDWYSSTFGLITILGQAVTALAVLLITIALLDAGKRIAAAVVHDLANLFQVTVILWAYVSFMQYLVIWSGNMQDDIVWFHHRTSGGWNAVGVALIALHFSVPFVLLLFQSIKRDLRSLAYVAGGVLFMRIVDMLWTIAPSSPSENAGSAHWLEPVAVLALGGAWWMCFAWQLSRAPLSPRAMTDVSTPATGGGFARDVVVN